MLNSMIHIGKNQVNKRKKDLQFMIDERTNLINNGNIDITRRYAHIAEIQDFKEELNSYI
jgi:hypothetical protein